LALEVVAAGLALAPAAEEAAEVGVEVAAAVLALAPAAVAVAVLALALDPQRLNKPDPHKAVRR
jgi:hypothetical protein